MTNKEQWETICKRFCQHYGYTLLFVNEDSCGIEKDGKVLHIYPDEMAEIISNPD